MFDYNSRNVLNPDLIRQDALQKLVDQQRMKRQPKRQTAQPPQKQHQAQKKKRKTT